MYVLAGTIPSQLCSTTGLSINVDNTQIACYADCLTSANVIIHGASAVCPDGSIMKQFIIIVSILFCFSIGSTVYYKYGNKFTWCHRYTPNINANMNDIENDV